MHIVTLTNFQTMKKFLLLLPLLALFACSSHLDPERAQKAVIEGETRRLPLLLQNLKLLGVEDITIDSLVLLTEDEPMSGLLYTTWTKKVSNWRTGKVTTKEIPMIVQIDSIRTSQTQKGYIEWQPRWDAAGANFFFAE